MRRIRTILVCGVLITALGAVAARGEVEAEVVSANVRVEKIFHYEEGLEVTNELAERGVSLAEVWPGLYAIDSRGYGANLTLFDETGKVTREYVFDKDRPEASGNFFPAANGEYFLNTWGHLGGFEYRGDPLGRTYYKRSGEEQWRGSGVESVGYVAVSPDGERVVYIQGNELYPRPGSKILFKNATGQTIATCTIPYLGEHFNFTTDGYYFLVSESHKSRRTADYGSAVFNQDGELLFFLERDFNPSISWGRSKVAIGGGKGYLFQIGYKITRTGYDTMRSFDLGRLLQVYDSKGNKSWEVKVSKKEWGAGVSADGRLIAYVPSDPGNELEIADIAGGKRVNVVPLGDSRPGFPLITLSDTGETVCTSCMARGSSSWAFWASLYSARGELVRFDADKAGSFHLTAGGDYVVFCGARTLAVFEINLASN